MIQRKADRGGRIVILVAGGTGFLGRHVVAALAARGLAVRVLSRAPDRAPQAGQKEAVGGDVREPATLAPAVAGCEAVVMAAQFPGHPVEVPRRGLTYDAVDRVGTENLLAAALRHGVRRFLYVSGAGVGAGRPEPWFVAKERAESAVRASGLEHVILRPSWAYGPGDRALNRIARIADLSPVVPVLGWNRQRVMPVYAGDVGEAIARVFETPAAWGRTFEIGGPEVLTMREVVRTLLRVRGKRRLRVPLPRWIAKLATAPLVLLPRPPLTPLAVDFATGDAIVDNTAVREVLGVDPLPLEEGLARYIGR
jgi:NADH dehydrogenase